MGSDIEEISDDIQLSESVFIFPSKTIGNHDNVYEGEVRSLVYGNRPCAIKFATLSEQNIREATILTQLGSHTNIIAIIESGIFQDLFNNHVYIALDKCHHENLRQYLAHRVTVGMEFDLTQAVDFAKQIVNGVMYIHDNSIVHLDLKPSNILISQSLHLIKIADFGLSIVVKSPKSKVFHKRQFGTNGYRPIESFGNGVVSRRTDIFSLGTVLFHLLSNGKDIFGDDTHVFHHNVMFDVTDTSGLLTENSLSTEHLIKCMVSLERCRRPTIWEVSNHPCWSGREAVCTFEYFADDEIDDNITDDEGSPQENKVLPKSDVGRKREFLEKMRELGFNRKPTIVLFDVRSQYLHRFDHRSKSVVEMAQFPDHVNKLVDFSTATIDEYLYILNQDRSVYRLEYGDAIGAWERLSDWSGDHGVRPPAAASSNAIFLAGRSSHTSHYPTRSVSVYNPLLDVWERLKDKPTATRDSALLCNDKFLYCIGGYDKITRKTTIVERMDLLTFEWTRLPNMKHHGDIVSAAECDGNIYVVGSYAANLSIELFDSRLGQWMEAKTTKEDISSFIFKILAIDDRLLFLVDRKGTISEDMIVKRMKLKWSHL